MRIVQSLYLLMLLFCLRLLVADLRYLSLYYTMTDSSHSTTDDSQSIQSKPSHPSSFPVLSASSSIIHQEVYCQSLNSSSITGEKRVHGSLPYSASSSSASSTDLIDVPCPSSLRSNKRVCFFHKSTIHRYDTAEFALVSKDVQENDLKAEGIELTDEELTLARQAQAQKVAAATKAETARNDRRRKEQHNIIAMKQKESLTQRSQAQSKASPNRGIKMLAAAVVATTTLKTSALQSHHSDKLLASKKLIAPLLMNVEAAAAPFMQNLSAFVESTK